MIKSPEIPSDNLYKFIAIFGLTIFISSIYFFIITQQNFYSQLEKRSKKHSEFLLRDAKNFSTKLSLENRLRIKELFIESKYNFIPNSINNKNALQCFKANSALELNLQQYTDLKLKLTIIDHEINNDKQNNEDEFKKEISNNYLTPTLCLMSISLLMIILGFALWYTNTQKFIDLELKNNASKKQD
jgi:hypothetical protein